MKKKTMLVIIAGTVLLAGAGGASLYFKPTLASQAKFDRKFGDPRQDKYVTLDQVIVMLKRTDDETASHYMAVDLVFKTTISKEKDTKDQFPLLRSITVNALSNYTFEVARTRTIEQVVTDINRAYNESYGSSKKEQPFSDVMIGKLIVE